MMLVTTRGPHPIARAASRRLTVYFGRIWENITPLVKRKVWS